MKDTKVRIVKGGSIGSTDKADIRSVVLKVGKRKNVESNDFYSWAELTRGSL